MILIVVAVTLKNGDCIKILKKLEPKSVNLIFADPPYNMSGKNNLTVKSGKPVTNFKGDWDVGIVIDAIKMSSNIDSVILVSGDGDYIPAVEYLQYHGVLVEVAAFGESSSGKLREAADDFTDISKNKKKFF